MKGIEEGIARGAKERGDAGNQGRYSLLISLTSMHRNHWRGFYPISVKHIRVRQAHHVYYSFIRQSKQSRHNTRSYLDSYETFVFHILFYEPKMHTLSTI
jgi:hypothetical protein